MASSCTQSFLLLLPFLMLLSTVVNSGSAPTPDSAATAEKYHKWCRIASDSQSCIKVMESIPGIQPVGYDDAGKIAELCLHFASNKTIEAKRAVDTLLAAAKGKPSSCLKACATNITSLSEVLVNPPVGQDNKEAYLTFIKGVRAKFPRTERPPACEKDCWNKTSSSSAEESGIVDQFHDIWTVVKVANFWIIDMFPYEDYSASDEEDVNVELDKQL